jgi:hypothetical protein
MIQEHNRGSPRGTSVWICVLQIHGEIQPIREDGEVE